MERALITGADGFVASHLTAELAREWDCTLWGLGLKPDAGAAGEFLTYRVVDLTDYEAVTALVGECRPDAVFHLAAQPSVAISWSDPWATYRANVTGQLNLLEALRRTGIEASFHVACSSEEYGKVPADSMPLGEGTPFRPCSHYAVSKVTQEVMALMYHEAFDWRVLVTRGFNQAGPGQSPDFVVSSFARQIALIEAGMCDPVIKVGNLEARRDFTDVRDTVRAYRLVMERGIAGTAYNICSGEAVAVRDILDILLRASDVDIKVEADPERQRPSDIPLMVGDCSRTREETGWRPIIPLEQTLRDALDHWRGCIASSEKS